MLTVPGFALITGAGSGLGRATALAFARAGAAGVHLVDINAENAKKASHEVANAASNPKFKSFASQLDLTNEDQVAKMLKATLEEFGRVDYAANIAGVVESPVVTADLSMDEYDRVHGINSRGVVLCMREELRAMRMQSPVQSLPPRPPFRGAITNMSSLQGKVALPGYTSYAASKHAVIGMTKAAAISHASDGIRVNAVCPGWVNTPLLMSAVEKSRLAAVVETVPQQRLALPEEIADIVVFLSSENASLVTGASWVADAGATISYA